MKENEIKVTILNLLDEPELKDKIYKMIDKRVSYANESDKKFSQYTSLGLTMADSKEERKLNAELQKLKNENEELNNNLENLRVENKKVYEENQRLNNINEKNNKALQNLQDLKHRLENDNTNLKNAETELNRRLENANKYISELRRNVDNLNEKIRNVNAICDNLEQELKQRLPEAWDLYIAYQKLPEDIKENFKFYFVKPSFESFVFGGADKNILEDLWEETKICIRRERIKEAAVLWDLFSYFLKMANQTYSEDRYGIVETDGEFNREFDYQRHQLEPGSKAQGIVYEIIIPGYTYQGKFKKKTVVKLK